MRARRGRNTQPFGREKLGCFESSSKSESQERCSRSSKLGRAKTLFQRRPGCETRHTSETTRLAYIIIHTFFASLHRFMRYYCLCESHRDCCWCVRQLPPSPHLAQPKRHLAFRNTAQARASGATCICSSSTSANRLTSNIFSQPGPSFPNPLWALFRRSRLPAVSV